MCRAVAFPRQESHNNPSLPIGKNYYMLTNAEINPPIPGEPAPTESTPLPDALEPVPSAYRNRLNRWAIARLQSPESLVTVARFRSHSDAEGHVRFLRQQFPLETFVIIVEQ